MNEPKTGRGRHNAIVARFLKFLTTHPNRALYLPEICSAIGVAERTLRAACEAHLGMGPIRYLKLRRMHQCGVRCCAQKSQRQRLRASLWIMVFMSLAAFLWPTATSSTSRLQRPCDVLLEAPRFSTARVSCKRPPRTPCRRAESIQERCRHSWVIARSLTPSSTLRWRTSGFAISGGSEAVGSNPTHPAMKLTQFNCLANT